MLTPRFSSRAFPPYSYVPGFSPHPVSDPRGHLYGQVPESSEPLVDSHWQESDAYLFGIDLFNHGYYWEAHEVWESLWHAAGRQGDMANFLKALIKLAAAGVKARVGNPAGVERHARRSVELLASLTLTQTSGETRLCGLEIQELMRRAAELADEAKQIQKADPDRRLAIMLAPQAPRL